MAPSRTKAGRGRASLLLLCLTAALLADCSASNGVHSQTPTSDPPSTTSTSASPTLSTRPSNKRPTTPSSGIPTPSVTASAQIAADAYIDLANAYNKASIDPAHADIAEINKYLSGKAVTIFDHSISSMKAAGQAYRGTPANPRLRVQTVFSSSSVFLTSCPAENTGDPFIEYDVATGKALPVAKRNPPPPYLLTLPMQLVGSQWKLVDLIQNQSKTCS